MRPTVKIQSYMLENKFAAQAEVRAKMRLHNLPAEDVNAFEGGCFQKSPKEVIALARNYVRLEMESAE